MLLGHTRRDLLLCGGAAAHALTAGRRATAQTSARRIVVPFAPGGALDLVVRIVQPRLSELLGQPVLVENRPGGSTVIATDAVAKAPADGSTLLAIADSFAINATLIRNTPYDAGRDFVAVAALTINAQVLVAGPGFAGTTFDDVLSAARAAPGRLAYASSGNGSGAHLVGETLRLAAGIDLQHVPYRGGGLALQDLLGGRAPLMVAQLPNVLPLIRDGRVRALAVPDAVRSPLLPEVPTFAEAGVPGVFGITRYGLVARREVPEAVLDRLNAAVNAALTDPAVAERLIAQGATPRPISRSEFGAALASEIARQGRIVRESGITLD